MHACEPSRASRCRAWVESNRAAMPLSLQDIAPYLRPQSGTSHLLALSRLPTSRGII